MVTAAAHKFGKSLVDHLAGAGLDVAITSPALLSSRVKVIERLDGQAIALRMNANDPVSVSLALQAIMSHFGSLDLLVHIAPHELRVRTPSGLDPCTEAAASIMQSRVVRSFTYSALEIAFQKDRRERGQDAVSASSAFGSTLANRRMRFVKPWFEPFGIRTRLEAQSTRLRT